VIPAGIGALMIRRTTAAQPYNCAWIATDGWYTRYKYWY